MKKPTLAEIAVTVLKQTKNDAVMSGDNGLLDQIAFTYARETGRTRITDNDLHPVNNRKNCRHQRILNALERRPDLFTKKIVRGVGWNRSRVRLFTLTPVSPEAKP